MLRRITGSRYTAPVEPFAADVAKPSENVPVNRRRALGDITNAFSNNDLKENNKKPVFAAPSIMQSDIAVEVMDDDMTTNDRLYMQRPSDDIDARDAGNPLLASAYVNPMFEHFNILEKEFQVNANYMSSQPYINDRMRCILVDWLVRQTILPNLLSKLIMF